MSGPVCWRMGTHHGLRLSKGRPCALPPLPILCRHPSALPARARSSGKKIEAPWTEEMEQQATAFYVRHYIDTFSQPEVCTALAAIPQLNMWDGERCAARTALRAPCAARAGDGPCRGQGRLVQRAQQPVLACLHPAPPASPAQSCPFSSCHQRAADHDIFDGYGSYDPDMQGCPVFQVGAGACWGLARRLAGWRPEPHSRLLGALHRAWMGLLSVRLSPGPAACADCGCLRPPAAPAGAVWCGAALLPPFPAGGPRLLQPWLGLPPAPPALIKPRAGASSCML